MSAPIGNKFWKLRSTNGRDKIFESPEELWEQAEEYFNWCVENPLIEIDFVGKDAIQVKRPKMRAFTWSGLELYLNISDLKHYRTNDSYKDFFPILTRIEKIIYTQKFEGSAAGFLNPSIIAKDLGLIEKRAIDQNITGGVSINWPEGD